MANHKGRRQYSEPIKSWSTFKALVRKAGKRVQPSGIDLGDEGRGISGGGGVLSRIPLQRDIITRWLGLRIPQAPTSLI